jgi:hypothetical protein
VYILIILAGCSGQHRVDEKQNIDLEESAFLSLKSKILTSFDANTVENLQIKEIFGLENQRMFVYQFYVADEPHIGSISGWFNREGKFSPLGQSLDII